MKKLSVLIIFLLLVFSLCGCECQRQHADELVPKVEKQCAEYLIDNCDTRFEDELSIIYSFIDDPADSDNREAVIDAMDSIFDKVDELNAAISNLYKGDVDFYID